MIDIPGYRIVRQLGRGGMATVYLAVQESVDREVALKVMSPVLLADPTYGERFLREARIAAKLHHRHVVGVHDVGREGDYHFIAMEYVGGGSVLPRGQGPREVAFALRVTREIAGALAYAHTKGFVHRDVKPDNILLREDGSSALTDFGIARAFESATRMTKTGAVVGTPHYMSPEQARGKTVDGRADLYSLGVVLYELLVGRVPFQADDSLAVGIMHITEPVPRLPAGYEALQPLVDRMLAKQPEDRFQTGDDVAVAVQELEFALATGQLRDLPEPSREARRRILDATPLPRPAPTDPPPAAPASPARSTSDAPTAAIPQPAVPDEPRIGRIDAAWLDRPRAHGRTQRAARDRRPLRSIAAIVVLAALLVALWSNQDRLRALLPETEVNALLVEGDAALQAGRLTGPGSASAAYAKVIELDADNTRAIEGRKTVGLRLVEQALAALAAGNRDEAQRLATDARQFLGGGPELAAFDEAWRVDHGRTDTLDALLSSARNAQATGRLAGTPDSAVELYQQVLAADPGNAIATTGIASILDALAAQAAAALAADERDRGAALIDQIARASASHPGLPDLRAALAEADKRKARVALEARRRGEGLLVQANAAIDANDPAAAKRFIRLAAATGVAAAELQVARGRLAELEERNAIAAKEADGAQRERAEKLVEAAEAAAAAGNLMDPPGDNAYDRYREALGADPRNRRARDGIEALPQLAKPLFADALVQKRLGLARQYLDVVEVVRRGDPDLPRLKRELALAHLAQAERQIGDGQYESAAKSIAKARELAPSEPGIVAAEDRLKAARGS